MKKLKFKAHLCDKILEGSKTSTWRLFDDKDLQIGDELEFINKDLMRHLLSEFRGEPISFVETSQVKAGVVCDVYSFGANDSKDLGIVRVSMGYKTPLQRVLKGDKTLEIFQTGRGVLNVTNADGVETRHSFPADTPAEIEITVGDLVQWEAAEDLVFAEVCYPPYQDGRFENLNE